MIPYGFEYSRYLVEALSSGFIVDFEVELKLAGQVLLAELLVWVICHCLQY